MASVFVETFDAVPVGNNINATNTNFDNLALGAGGTITAISGGAHGTAARVTSTSAGSNLREDWLAAASNRYVRMYVRIAANPPNQMGVMSIRSSTTVRANIQISTTGKIRLRNATTLVATTTNGLILNQWARLEWHWNAASNTQALRLYTGADVENPASGYTEEITGVATNLSADNSTIGILDPTTSGQVDLDDYALDDTTWVGPTGGAAESWIKAAVSGSWEDIDAKHLTSGSWT